MPKTIQIRNVPDALHRRLKARAAKAGMSLSKYLLTEIEEIAEKPTLAEIRERLHQHASVSTPLEGELIAQQTNAEKVRDTERLEETFERRKRPLGKRTWKREDLYVRGHNR
jgi:antitoxin FitA